jgi:broad-specificity NMP kinase
MTEDERTTEKYTQACDLAHEVFLPSYALVLEDAAPRRLYSELEARGYTWTGSTWEPRSSTPT